MILSMNQKIRISLRSVRKKLFLSTLLAASLIGGANAVSAHEDDAPSGSPESYDIPYIASPSIMTKSLQDEGLLAPLSISTATSLQAGGPIVLMGIDAEDGGIGGHGPISVYVSVVRDILNHTTNNGNGILVFGGGSDPRGYIHSFWDAIGNQTGQTVTYASNISTVNFNGYKMLAVASDEYNTPGGLTQQENNYLGGRQGDIAAFINAGGGLIGLSSDFTNPYAYLSGIGSFSVRTNLSYDNINPTTDGTAIGITNSLDICCWHDEYTNFPSFLKVLATNPSDGKAAVIGGAKVVVDNPPTVTANADRGPNSNGWYNADVTVSFTAVDNDTTPVQSVDSPKIVSTEGANQVITGKATDTRGLVGEGSVTINIDKTNPQTTAAANGTTGNSGWYKSDVDVTLTASDAHSGVEKTEYSLDGGNSWQPYTGTIQVTNEGTQTIKYRSTDLAGNEEDIQSIDVKIDRTAPQTTAAANGTAGNSGWYKSDVDVTLTASDAHSGVEKTEYSLDGGSSWQPYTGAIHITKEGGTTILYRSIDNAGNEEQPHSVNVNIDKTGPTLIISLNNSVLWPPNHKMVTINATVDTKDSGSGVALDSVQLISITSNEQDNGLGDGDTANDIQHAAFGTDDRSFELRAERSGKGTGREYVITYSVTDNAGNTSTQTAVVKVPHDQGK